jgi:hypothetical protein
MALGYHSFLGMLSLISVNKILAAITLADAARSPFADQKVSGFCLLRCLQARPCHLLHCSEQNDAGPQNNVIIR